LETPPVSGDEPVTSPDQLKPTISKRLSRFGAVLTILLLLAMAATGNQQGHIEDIFLIGLAALILLALIADFFLRRSGLRSE
jgi:Protein of unknown function (DUF2631)